MTLCKQSYLTPSSSDAYGNLRTFMYDRLARLIKAEDVHASNDTTFGVREYVYGGNGVRYD